MRTAAVLGHGLVEWLPFWLFLRMLVGLGMMCQYMVIESWLNEQADAKQRGLVFSGYMAVGFVLEIMDPKKGFKFMCNDNQQSPRVAQLVSIFFWTKFIEFLDTIIMILRKSTSQLSFLPPN